MAFGNAVGEGFNNGEITKLTVADLGPDDGIWVYSTAEPEAGTLLMSFTAAAGTDAAGNKYLAGETVYGPGYAASLNAGFLAFYTGSLSAGWALQAQVLTDASGDLILEAGGGGSIQLASPVVLSTPLAVGGTSGTAGLPNGTISGTSGPQSAGTAHTHGGGSYAVTNGVHGHGAGSYEV